jgi:hypothetical protein
MSFVLPTWRAASCAGLGDEFQRASLFAGNLTSVEIIWEGCTCAFPDIFAPTLRHLSLRYSCLIPIFCLFNAPNLESIHLESVTWQHSMHHWRDNAPPHIDLAYNRMTVVDEHGLFFHQVLVGRYSHQEGSDDKGKFPLHSIIEFSRNLCRIVFELPQS